ncbi:MAG: energy-coupling factor ABC transporter permease [Hydrogeniiclostridium mannosilyticum]
MHLGNGIICPVTGIPMLAIAAGTAFYAYKKARRDFTKDKILPTVALTALVFALQMINFAIPSTGSSGHIVGGMLLAALLGPYAGFLAMCSILIVQAVFFADGGLLALGCNIFNMGFLACFAAYPLIFKPLPTETKQFSE